jgi:hypothetical protein
MTKVTTVSGPIRFTPKEKLMHLCTSQIRPQSVHAMALDQLRADGLATDTLGAFMPKSAW